MELRQLEHFVAVAEEQSFTRAARRLGHVQSALSVSVQAIERELELQLFDRNTHGVRLTEAGRQLLPAARATLEAAAEVRASAAAVNGALSGRLAIGLMQSLAAALDLPARLGAFHRDHPRVAISIRSAGGGSTELLAGVASGALDMAFTAAPTVPGGVHVEPVSREELQLRHASGHGPVGEGPIGLEQLGDLPFIDFPVGWGIRAATDAAFAAAGRRRQIAMEVADLSTLIALVQHGLGVALLPDSLVATTPALVRRELNAPVSWEIVLATPAGRQLSPVARAFLEQMGTGAGP